MFNTLKNFFGIDTLELTEKKERNMFARITDNNELYGPAGELIGVYSRRRDAVRGAKRRGLELA